MGSRKIICGVCRGGVQEQWDGGPAGCRACFLRSVATLMTYEAELSLGWADEGVCPYTSLVMPESPIESCASGTGVRSILG
jgi:hypothetical protein